MDKIKNYGYLEPIILPDEWILGGGNFGGEILQPDGQWLDYLPEVEEQKRFGIESSNCTGFTTTSVVEILMKRKYNK